MRFLASSRSAFLSFCTALAAFPGLCFSAQVSLSGKITFSDGNPIVGVTVAVPTPTGQKETSTDVQGNYSFSIDEGTYEHLRIRNMGTELAGLPRMIEHVAEKPLVVSGNTVKNVTMPAFYRVHGTLRSPVGAALPNVRLTLQKWDGLMTQLPSDEGSTGSDGAYELFCTGGQARLSVPADTANNFAAFNLTFALAKDTLLDPAYTLAPVLSGTVKTSDGSLVSGIVVAMVKDGNQTEKRTDSQGRFSFSISAGTVTELRIRAMNDTVSLVPANLEFRAYENFAISGDLVKNVTLPKYPLFTGKLLGAGNAPLAGFTLTTHAWTMNMRQSPSDYATTDADGRFALRCASGSNQLVIDPPAGNAYAKVIQDFTIAADSSGDIHMVKGAVFAGKVLFADSTPVHGVTVAISNGLEQKETVTDAQGNFKLTAQPGKYGDFRIRNMSQDVAGIPRMLEHTVRPEGVTLSDSLWLTVTLPPFRKMSGKVVNASLQAVTGVTVSSAAWKNGMNQLPNDESQTGAGGAYELFLPLGTNWITVRPPSGSLHATTSFTVKVEDPIHHDIILADQAKGVASIQPSVVGQGKSGKISIIGINTAFTQGVTEIGLGSGVTVTGITVHSDISITAQVSVADTAGPGVRSVRVVGPQATYVGAELFTVTAPVEAGLVLDGAGKLLKTVIIEDGTGTQLKVDSGTTVKLPPGAAASLGFEAPVIKNDQVNPAAAEFLQVQREFSPSGVVFDPPAALTFHYQDQDMKGVDESQLKAYKYDNKADTVVAEYKVLERDTAKNLLKQEVKTFSLFRLAKTKGAIGVRGPEAGSRGGLEISGLRATRETGKGFLRLSFRLQGNAAGKPIRFRLVSLAGETVAELNLSAAGPSLQVVDWPLQGSGGAAGFYKLIADVDGRRLVQPVILGL